ncbi:MAG: methylated-DNA--[protein]-cysteine S-methyltransferase, partial [Anaerolineae bacterium]|nr:methylated-DNA--[protein]-cysteine S-methyltransferase [Anaerolineae bacterium]
DTHFLNQPSLEAVAAEVGLSEFHLQRLFKRWAGISPKRFLQFLTAEHAKHLLQNSHNVLDATYESGLSSPGRLHDLMVNIHAMTPGEIKSQGAGLTLYYGIYPTPFGDAVLAVTERGICGLDFITTCEDVILNLIQAEWPLAELKASREKTQPVLEQIFSMDTPLSLFLKGTNFQIKVWESLLKIPFGQFATYEDIATSIGQPTAARAVGSAVGSNPVAFLIPCHRVIRKTGAFGNYKWGLSRKKAIIGWEAAHIYAEAATGD